MAGSRHARLLAARVVAAVLPPIGVGERLDAALDRLLDVELTEDFEPRDRALCHEIATGTIRHRRWLDHLLTRCMARPLPARLVLPWALLRTALYQAHFLRVPARAAVNEAVELIKGGRDAGLAGFANAVLRKAAALDGEQVLAELTDPLERLAIQHSYPSWLVGRWAARLNDHEALATRLAAGNRQPPLTVRVNTLVTSRAAWLAQLGEGRGSPCRLAPDGVEVQAGLGVEALPGYREGAFAVQDEAAQLISLLLAPQPGERLLDACAAPGGKTAHLAALSNNQAPLLALEKRPERLTTLRVNLARLRVTAAEVRMADAGVAESVAGHLFQAVLVDAPCSGTGVIRRHPDIKWRRQPPDLAELANEQGRLLENLSTATTPGSRLVYATCSLEPEENQAQVEQFLHRHPDWQRAGLPAWLPGDLRTNQGDFHSEPSGMDGFYAAVLKRRG